MCGIFGSIGNKDKFNSLYDINKIRGDFSLGLCTIDHACNEYHISKHKGKHNTLVPFIAGDNDIMLGHTQAPTTSAQTWKESTSHPFRVGKWTLAHNGVLTNYRELEQSHVPGALNTCPVDSYIIAKILDKIDDGKLDPIKVISRTASMLKGTFACWIVYNTTPIRIFVIRSSCTLFTNADKTIFSSVSDSVNNCTIEVDQGIVYEYTSGSLIPKTKFQNNTPFFIPS